MSDLDDLAQEIADWARVEGGDLQGHWDHPAEDVVARAFEFALKASAAAMRELGGDDSAGLVPQAKKSETDKLAQRLSEIARNISKKLTGVVASVGASGFSIGVAAWPPSIQVAVNWDAKAT